MMPSRRALFYHANSFLRSNSRYHNNYVSPLSSISHKNDQGPKTPEELSRLYKTTSDDSNTTRSSTGSGARLNATPKGMDDRNVYEEPFDSVARTAKVAAAGALETGLRFGKMMKQTVDGIWESTKETTENMRDSVADDTGRRGAQTFDYIDDNSRRPAQASDIDDAGRRGAQTFDIDDVDDTGCRRAQASDIDDAGRCGAHTFGADDVDVTGSRGAPGFDYIDDRIEDKFVEDLRGRTGGCDLKDGGDGR